jgi:hypothetical protein
LSAGTQKSKQKKENQVEISQKDLKEYTSKLQDEFLKSDQTIKVQKAMMSTMQEKKFLPPSGLSRVPSGKIRPKSKIRILAKDVDKTSPSKDGDKTANIVKLTIKR